jgi:hypothetical protein
MARTTVVPSFTCVFKDGTNIKFCLFILNFNFLNTTKCLLIVLAIFSTCSLHFASWDNVTPTCLWLEVLDINLPLNETFKLLFYSIFEQVIISVVSGLNDMGHFPDQVLSLFKSWFITNSKVSWMGLEYPKDISSANNLFKERSCSQISLT